MARKERNNVDYFPHSVTHGKKMFYLRDKFNNDGYAVWFMLLEELGRAEYHYLDLEDDIQLMYLSSQFKVSELKLNEIIETLVRFEEFDKQLWNDDKILFNEKFNENISDAYKKRSNNCVDKNSLLLLLQSKGRSLSSKSNPKQAKGNLKGDGNPQRIVKESKVKESKVNNSKEEIPAYSIFEAYALEKKPTLCVAHLKLKYESWIENEWVDGHGNPIQRWKSKVLATLPFINEKAGSKQEEVSADEKAFAENQGCISIGATYRTIKGVQKTRNW